MRRLHQTQLQKPTERMFRGERGSRKKRRLRSFPHPTCLIFLHQNHLKGRADREQRADVPTSTPPPTPPPFCLSTALWCTFSCPAAVPTSQPVVPEALAPPNNILFSPSLPHDANSDAIEALFQQFPRFKEVRMIEAKPGIAFVEYGDELQQLLPTQDCRTSEFLPHMLCRSLTQRSRFSEYFPWSRRNFSALQHWSSILAWEM